MTILATLADLSAAIAFALVLLAIIGSEVEAAVRSIRWNRTGKHIYLRRLRIVTRAHGPRPFRKGR